MSDRDVQCLEAIKAYHTRYRYAPTIRELARALNVSSTATIANRLERLKRYGVISYSPRISRTIVVLEAA